jgi:hypothetical protein
MIKILYLDTFENWNIRMDRTWHNYIIAMHHHKDIKMTITGPGFPNFKTAFDAFLTNKPNLIIIDHPKSIPGWKDIKTFHVPIVKMFNETFDIKNTKREILETGISLSIFHHPEHIQDFKDLFSDHYQFRGIQHRIDPMIFKEYKNEKSVDILIAGHTNDYLYPFRARLLQMIKDGKFGKWKTKILEHPGYSVENIDVQIKNYVNDVNRSKIVLGCSSLLKYPLSKYMEYPACGSLMAGDIPNYKHDFFKDIGIELNPEWSDDKIVEVIDYWLTNDIERIEKTNHAYELIHSQYTTKQYVEQFIEILYETGIVVSHKEDTIKEIKNAPENDF